MIPWYVPVILRIIVANGVGAGLIRYSTRRHSRVTRFFLQFLLCGIAALVYASYTSQPFWSNVSTSLIAIGFFNGLAAYCQWRAIDISLSITSLFTFGDDIIAMALSYVLLEERKLLNNEVLAGIFLCLAAVILFAVLNYRRQHQTGEEAHVRPALFLYVALYSIIWGVATFFMRYFGLRGTAEAIFLSNWYVGTSIAAALLLRIARRYPSLQGGEGSLTRRDIPSMLGLSATIIASLGLTYWSYEHTPQTVVQPFFLVGEMVLPVLIGFYVFNERRQYDYREKLLFVAAIMGGIFIAFSFQQ